MGNFVVRFGTNAVTWFLHGDVGGKTDDVNFARRYPSEQAAHKAATRYAGGQLFCYQVVPFEQAVRELEEWRRRRERGRAEAPYSWVGVDPAKPGTARTVVGRAVCDSRPDGKVAVRFSAFTYGELCTQLYDVEKDRDSWKNEAAALRKKADSALAERDSFKEQCARLQAEVDAARKEQSEWQTNSYGHYEQSLKFQTERDDARKYRDEALSRNVELHDCLKKALRDCDEQVGLKLRAYDRNVEQARTIGALDAKVRELQQATAGYATLADRNRQTICSLEAQLVVSRESNAELRAKLNEAERFVASPGSYDLAALRPGDKVRGRVVTEVRRSTAAVEVRAELFAAASYVVRCSCRTFIEKAPAGGKMIWTRHIDEAKRYASRAEAEAAARTVVGCVTEVIEVDA